MKGLSLFLICILITLSQRLAYTQPYHVADSVAATWEGHSITDLKLLSHNLTSNLESDKEKFRAIFQWVCTNIEGDHVLYMENKHMREKTMSVDDRAKWNARFSTKVFRELVKNKKTVCSGYAYLIKELATHAGIPCRIVDGYGRTATANIKGSGTPNHSWNAVKLAGSWYLCDATWSSGYLDPKERTFVKRFDDGYFLTTPVVFARTHYPLDTTWLLLSNKPSLTDFLNAPIFYSSATKFKIDNVSPRTLDITVQHNSIVRFQFEAAPGEIAKLQLQINGNMLNEDNYRLTGSLYTIEHCFKRKGRYVVHILLNSKPCLSYQVRVF
jgi:hypothetical protein